MSVPGLPAIVSFHTAFSHDEGNGGGEMRESARGTQLKRADSGAEGYAGLAEQVHDLDQRGQETSARTRGPGPVIERRRSERPSRGMSESLSAQKFPARRSATSRSSSRRVSIFSPDASILSLIRRRSLPSFDTAGFTLWPFFGAAALSVALAMPSF